MRKILLLAIISLFTGISAMAQHSIQSMIFDSKNGLPLELATVRLLNPKDSSLVQGCKTNTTGSFVLSRIKPGNYTLLISMIGYKDYRQSIIMDGKDVILKNIQMEEETHVLGEVQVTGTAAQMTVKGDTLEYNATAFKTAQNAVVEDLIKRLPGVEISSDGKITVNGEEIKKIRVDGKKFFNGDIEMATKNIPADMIDKIQVHDQKSDMAQLTGFEDDDTERILNLTTKANRRYGVFGNVTGGGGMDSNEQFRYDGNAFVNIMAGKTQTAITAGTNNTNTSRSGRGRTGIGNPSGGITETQNFGINNNSEISKNLKLGGDASFNHSTNVSKTETNKESYLRNETYTNSSNRNSNIENYSANMRLEMEWKPDTLSTYVIQPSIGYNRSFSNANNSYTYLTGTDTTSLGRSSNHGNGNSLNANLNFIYNRKYASKKGRSLTINAKTGISQSDNISWNLSDKTTSGVKTTVDQYTNNTSDRYNASLRTSFVEPLWNVRNLLETAISLKATNSESVKDQYKKDPEGYYTLKDSTYSNNYSNNFFSETLEMNYRYVAKDYNLMLGVKAEPSQTEYTRHYANRYARDTTYGVINFAPTARFQYNFGKKKFARLDYRGSTDQPSINQMQPVKNNSDLMNETVGNPNLNPEFEHNLRIFFSGFNDVTFSSLNVALNARITKDALVTNSIYETSGKQYSQTVNAKDKPYSLFGNIMFNTPIIQKRLHFNTNTSFGLDERYGYSKKGVDSIDTDILPLGDLSDTRKYSASEAISLTFTNDVLELGARGSLRYSNTYNTLSNRTSETYDWTASGNFVVHLPYNFNIASDLNYTTLQGYSNFDKNQLIWNASFDKSFFNSKGVLALKVYDILRQQLNIRQSIGDNYIQYSRFNTLTSYFILSFSYKLNQFKGNRSFDRNRFNRFGPGEYSPRRGDNDGAPSPMIP